MFTKNSWGTSSPTLSKLGPTFLLLPFTLNRFVKPLPWHMDKQLLKFNPSYEVLWLLPQLTVKFLTEILHPTDILKADSTCFHQHSRISSASGPFWWYMARRVATIAADTNPCLSSLLPPKKKVTKKSYVLNTEYAGHSKHQDAPILQRVWFSSWCPLGSHSNKIKKLRSSNLAPGFWSTARNSDLL